ncbi:glycosyltransferase [Amycolatopsis sp. NPDC059021]|uniref:glycosyltransferase n=1 Tax=Amycolatopsis sp. NPDC059021 TaxID=3346704 RepID=UPI0036721033
MLRGAQGSWPEQPPSDWMPVLTGVVWACPEHLADLPELLAAERFDGLVIDCLMFGALAAAERLGVPATVLVHSAPGALVPPGGGMDTLVLDAVNDVRTRADLPAVQALWDTWQPFRAVCTSVPALDPIAADVPARCEFTGPVFAPHTPRGRERPWSADDGRPLVLVSFSTGLAWDQRSRIARTVTALADGGHRVVVTTGMTGADELPTDPDVLYTRFLPHAEILPDAAVTVTHAGHGTIAASLAHGVPVVCLPNAAADQPVLAAQVARLGAGLALDGDTATPVEIAEAVRTVLTDPSYAGNAARLAKIIDAFPGADGTADRLESLASPVR